MSAVETCVVLLVGRPGRISQRRIGAHMRERAADEVVRPLADSALDEAALDPPQAEVIERPLEHGDEIAEGVDQRAIQIEDGGIVTAKAIFSLEVARHAVTVNGNPSIQACPANPQVCDDGQPPRTGHQRAPASRQGLFWPSCDERRNMSYGPVTVT